MLSLVLTFLSSFIDNPHRRNANSIFSGSWGRWSLFRVYSERLVAANRTSFIRSRRDARKGRNAQFIIRKTITTLLGQDRYGLIILSLKHY